MCHLWSMVFLPAAGDAKSKECVDKFQKDVVCRKKPYDAGPCDVDDVCECQHSSHNLSAVVSVAAWSVVGFGQRW
jgi:hypothetical protein